MDDLFPATLPADVSRTATFSPCRRYRYQLWRRWGSAKTCAFIGLNPSTADELIDDPTIRRCINYAKGWGYGSLCMLNLFAFRATDPRDMKAEPEPIGPANDSHIAQVAASAGIVIAAWGTHGQHLERSQAVLRLLAENNIPLHCLKLTQDGHPNHPLYLGADLTPIPFR